MSATESRQREPNQTNETKIVSLSFIYSGKLSNIAYLWVAKVCESLGLAVNLKVNLEFREFRGVFSQCNDYHISVLDLFYSNRDLSKSDHVCGSESCHEQRRLLRISEKELMLLIRLEKVTKPSLKSLDSTNPQSDSVTSGAGPRAVGTERGRWS